jgi:uncharacterized protein YecE (DUF72 family)
VPFRFAVQMPQLMTRDGGLTRAGEPLRKFADEITGLGARLGPVLVQLPPSSAFEPRRVGLPRGAPSPARRAIVCEPRHARLLDLGCKRRERSSVFRTARRGRPAAPPG